MVETPLKYPLGNIVVSPRDLHKKIGQFAYIDPTDSDYQEGQRLSQLWFMDADLNMYLVWEGTNPTTERE